MMKAETHPPASFLHSTVSYPYNNQYHHVHHDILDTPDTPDTTSIITTTSPTSTITIQDLEQRVTEQILIPLWTMQEATIHTSTTAYPADNHTQDTFE
eukprot:scaffold181584_cov60-Attheya_sp.AAC.3